MVMIIKNKEQLKVYQDQIQQLIGKKQFNASLFTRKISLKENPVDIQKRLRDEWFKK